ncbi:MAG: ATP-dependent protease subunit HslV [Armatimonadota bacterium]
MSPCKAEWRSTTILVVARDGVVAMGGDGQITLGDVAIKHGAQKVRTMRNGTVLAGYAGAAADALALFDRLEGKLDEYSGNLQRAAVELVKEWRTDRALRHLDAMLVVADRENILLVSGHGELIKPDDQVLGIGSGGVYAEAAGRALMAHTGMTAEDICRAAMGIAARLCVYTNENIIVQTLE